MSHARHATPRFTLQAVAAAPLALRPPPAAHADQSYVYAAIRADYSPAHSRADRSGKKTGGRRRFDEVSTGKLFF